MIGPDDWPETADHRQIRRWVVRLMRPGYGSGSGILVGPDLVLTCYHVLQDLFGRDDPASEAAAAAIVVEVGLEGWRGGGPGEAEFTRYLRTQRDGDSLPDAPAWHGVAGGGDPGLDFALLRLEDNVDPGTDWLSFQEYQTPARLARQADPNAVELFMYHFPDPADGTPYIEPRLSFAGLPQDWTDTRNLITHQVASEKGSSGAMLFAKVEGARPFPLALHRGRELTGNDKVAVPVSAVLNKIAASDPVIFAQLTTPPDELRRKDEVQHLAKPKLEQAQILIDRELQARTAVAGTVGRSKKVQPVFEASREDMTLFQRRLAEFALPLRILTDASQQQKVRCWALAGGGGSPPVDKGIEHWGNESLGGEGWLQGGHYEATSIVENRAADALKLGASVLLTARAQITQSADYRLLQSLLVALAQALQGQAAAANVLLLLWIGDAGLKPRARAQGRDELQRFVGSGRALQPVVGMPMTLSSVAKDDLAPWSQDVVGAFKVRPSEVALAIDTAWNGLNRVTAQPAAGTGSVPGRHEFDDVVQALENPLQAWVQLHFRRLLETGRQIT